MDFAKLIDHKAVVPGLLGVSVFSAGVAAGMALERFVLNAKKTVDISEETNDHPRLFDPDDPPKQERVVITLDEALAMRDVESTEPEPVLWSDVEPAIDGDGEPIKWVDEETLVAEDYEPAVHIPEVMAEKTASEVVPIPFNVLESAEVEEWDWEREVTKREENPEGPYPIHEEEFASRSVGFHIETLLYYGVDQIICDESDPRDLMYDYASKLGDVQFGYGSNDEDVAYVRSPKERTDYKITQLHDSYSESVMGIQYESEAEQDELAHMNRPLRMRRLE